MKFKLSRAIIWLFLSLTIIMATSNANTQTTIDAAIIDVTPSKYKAYVGETIAINVTVKNNGTAPIQFNVTVFFGNLTAYYAIGTLQTGQLAVMDEKILTFYWNTSNVKPCQKYTIKANCTIENDQNPENDEFIDGEIKITIFADINGDGKVDIADLVLIIKAFGSYPEHPRWNPDADLNNNNKIDIIDLFITIKNHGKQCESP